MTRTCYVSDGISGEARGRGGGTAASEFAKTCEYSLIFSDEYHLIVVNIIINTLNKE